jgi:3-hydroxyisobutyrate dehydrogenase
MSIKDGGMSNGGGEAAMTKPDVAVVGIGRMGGPMAHHIAAAGFPLMVHDTRGEVARAFAASRNVRVAEQLSDVADAGVVVLVLPSSREVGEVVAGDGGLASRLRLGALIIDCSSSDPMETRRLGALLAARGIALVDAPVAGGVAFAEEGSLDALVGGEGGDVARARPVLEAFTRSISPCGVLGSAHAMKALNNFVNAQVLVTYLEAMVIARRFGIDIDTIATAMMRATTDRNHPFGKKVEGHVLSGRFATGMALSLIAKDVGTAKALADALDVWAPVAAATSELWADAAREIGAGADQTEVVRLWERRAGLELRRLPAPPPN